MLQEEFLGRIFCIITHLKNKRKKNVVNVLDFEAELLFSVDTRNQLTNCSILDCTNFYFFSREKKNTLLHSTKSRSGLISGIVFFYRWRYGKFLFPWLKYDRPWLKCDKRAVSHSNTHQTIRSHIVLAFARFIRPIGIKKPQPTDSHAAEKDNKAKMWNGFFFDVRWRSSAETWYIADIFYAHLEIPAFYH